MRLQAPHYAFNLSFTATFMPVETQMQMKTTTKKKLHQSSNESSVASGSHTMVQISTWKQAIWVFIRGRFDTKSSMTQNKSHIVGTWLGFQKHNYRKAKLRMFHFLTRTSRGGERVKKDAWGATKWCHLHYLYNLGFICKMCQSKNFNQVKR